MGSLNELNDVFDVQSRDIYWNRLQEKINIVTSRYSNLIVDFIMNCLEEDDELRPDFMQLYSIVKEEFMDTKGWIDINTI